MQLYTFDTFNFSISNKNGSHISCIQESAIDPTIFFCSTFTPLLCDLIVVQSIYNYPILFQASVHRMRPINHVRITICAEDEKNNEKWTFSVSNVKHRRFVALSFRLFMFLAFCFFRLGSLSLSASFPFISLRIFPCLSPFSLLLYLCYGGQPFLLSIGKFAQKKAKKNWTAVSCWHTA